MKISLYQLNKIINDLPAPGSINFENAQTKIEVPLFRTYGMLSMGNADDVIGMEPGHAEMLHEQVGKLVFHKEGKGWDMEVFCVDEVKYAIEETKRRQDDITRKSIAKEVERELLAKEKAAKKKLK